MAGDAFSAAPELDGDLQDRLERIQAEELSRAPAPGRLRAADIIQVKA